MLVPIDGRARVRLALARRLAERLQAELCAVHVAVPAYMELPFEVSAGAAVVSLLAEVDEERRRSARAVLDEELARPGVTVAWRESNDGAPIRSLARQALYADLLVLGQQEEGVNTGLPGDFVESVMLASGRPALVVPYAGEYGAEFRTALVAWKESPPSARALSAALPLLRTADAVHVVHWDVDDEDAVQAGDIEAFLRRHGVSCKYRSYSDTAGGVGESLLGMAADLSADLLVMGCYGHTRAREFVLGGVSRTLLRSMTLPVLMSH